MGVITPFLAGNLGLIILSWLLKVTKARWLALPILILALGVLVSLAGGAAAELASGSRFLCFNSGDSTG